MFEIVAASLSDTTHTAGLSGDVSSVPVLIFKADAQSEDSKAWKGWRSTKGTGWCVVSSVVVLLELFLLSVSGEKQEKHSHSGGGGWFTAHPCGETDGMLTFIR